MLTSSKEVPDMGRFSYRLLWLINPFDNRGGIQQLVLTCH